MVVMMAFLTPMRRIITSTTGVMQLVVQDAQETIFAPAFRLGHPVDDGADLRPLGGAER